MGNRQDGGTSKLSADGLLELSVCLGIDGGCRLCSEPLISSAPCVSLDAMSYFVK
jgi:hypothetical protein